MVIIFFMVMVIFVKIRKISSLMLKKGTKKADAFASALLKIGDNK